MNEANLAATVVSEYREKEKKPDNPLLVEFLIKEQERIRQKYALPSREMRFSAPREFEQEIRARAVKNGIESREKSDCGDFFTENSAGGVYLSDLKTIGASVRDTTHSCLAGSNRY